MSQSGAKGSTAGGASSIERLRELLYEEGGLMRDMLTAAAPAVGDGSAGPAQLAASGPRADGRGPEYELLIETIYEGYLLHYHSPRVVRSSEDDLGLLAGDRLYALGLARLVTLGDVEAVAELADVITLTALAHGSGRPELADAVWAAGARAVGWGASPLHERAKALTRAGSSDALEAMRAFACV
ncbi:MAG TPA: hypothetical protein VIG42_06185 [Solirubrobacteraceae bacterium]